MHVRFPAGWEVNSVVSEETRSETGKALTGSTLRHHKGALKMLG